MWRCIPGLGFACLLGCLGQIPDGSQAPPPGEPGAPVGPGVPAGTGGGGAGPPPGGAPPAAGAACDPRQPVVPGRYPLRRLSGAEWMNTVRDLLGDVPNLSVQFPPDEVGLGGFTNSGDALRVDGLLLERIRDAGETLAQTAVARLA